MNEKQYKIIPALDTTDLSLVEGIVQQLGDRNDIYGFKLGFSLGLSYGLPRIVELIRSRSKKPIIYDHQKAGTDIPDTGALFANTCRKAGIDEVILFPQAGPATLASWIEAVRTEQMKVIVGGLMTHRAYLETEGGFILDGAVTEIYRRAYQCGVRAFVVPLTKPDLTRTLVNDAGLQETCEFYSPGFGKQGGDPNAYDFLRTHYIIIGRSILSAADPGAYVDSVMQTVEGVS